MSITRKITPFLLSALLLITGCRSHKEAAQTARPTDSNAQPIVVQEPVPEPEPVYTPQYYSSNFTASSQGITINGQLRIQSDSVIWGSATKIIELGRAKLTPDSVIIYAKVMGRCFRGSYMDLYRRYRYRTTFDEIYQMITADDAERQIAIIARRFGIEAEIHLDPWKKVPSLTFPFSIPANVKPL